MKKLLLLLLAVLPLSVFGQTPIGGVVTDSHGAPLPGVNIQVKGTSRGVQSDFDGNFSIELTTGDVLLFSYVGFVVKEVTYASQQSLSVTMEEDTASLDEVVLTGYTKQSTRDIVSSVSVIQADDFIATSPVSLEQALQGQASGITVGAEGGPGGKAAVRIRGFGTVNDNDPLYIIDGTQSTADLNDINPADIKSIQILKDASAASIFGVRASNGVIVIETKKGSRNQKTTFSVDSYVGVDYIPRSAFPDLANPQQLANADWQAHFNTVRGDSDPSNDNTPPSNQQFGSGPTPVLPNYITPAGSQTADESQYREDNRITRANKSGTDWFDEFYNAAVVQNTNISMAGGSETSNYYWAVGLLDQQGVGLETNFNRYNTRLNSSHEINNRFRMGENFNFAYTEKVEAVNNQNEGGVVGQLYRIHPLIPVRDVAGNFAGTQSPGLGNGANPIAVAFNNRNNKDKRFRVLGNMFAELDIIDGLTMKTNLGLEYLHSDFSVFNPPSPQNEAAVFNNALTEFSSTFTRTIWTNALTYNKKIGAHDFNIFGGLEFQKANLESISATRTTLLFNEPENFIYLNLGTDGIANSGTGGKGALFSAFTKIDYKFDDKYIFGFTLRRDESSSFSESNRTDYFPAVSAGWRVSNEDFLSDSSAITDLKIIGSYGELGNERIPLRLANQYTSGLDFINYPNGNTSLATGYYLASRGNPDLKWETTKTLNFGFDVTFFNELNLKFDWYTADTEDMLINSPQDPAVFGDVNTIFKNIGVMNNTGIDLGVGYGHKTASGFNYDIQVNLSHYKNEVVELDPDKSNVFLAGSESFGQTISRTAAGEPLASFYGLVSEGLDENGRIKFKDVDGDGVFDQDKDRDFIGNPHPDFTYGINFSADYKSFDVSLLIQGSQGNDIYNFTKYFTETNVFPGQKSLDYINAWTPSNTGASVPALTTDSDVIGLESSVSSHFVEDGSYLRLKNIQFGYSLPDTFIESIKMDKLRIYIQAKNILTITGYEGLDPEISIQDFDGGSNSDIGIDRGAYPISRSLLLGLSASF